jgi:integrase/recombinase XerC
MDSIEEFTEYLKKERRSSKHTITAYAFDLNQFQSHLTEVSDYPELLKADHHDIRSWIISIMDDHGYDPRSVNRKVSTLRSFYRYNIRLGHVELNPTAKVLSMKTSKKLPMFLEVSQMEQLLNDLKFTDDFSGRRDRLIIELLYCTGMRRSELIGLIDMDIDFSQNQLKVLGKRNKERLIPFSRNLSEEIRFYMKERDELFSNLNSELGFLVNDKGEKVNEGFVYRKVNAYLRMVSTLKRRSPHVLRHTFATHMLNNGADLNSIKEILGHASLSATQVYTHNSIEKLNSIYKQAHPRA